MITHRANDKDCGGNGCAKQGGEDRGQNKSSGRGLVVGPQYGTTRALAAELLHLLMPAALQRWAVSLRSS